MDKIQVHDGDTLESGSGSGLSDLSALENETTDDFGRKLLQYQRDARRLNNATRGRQQAFSKARPHPRAAERLAREERVRDHGDAPYHERTSSNELEPPVNVPRQWGRHARRQTDWLRKITSPSENGDVHLPANKSEASTVHMTDAEEYVHSIETTPPSLRRGRYSATPPSSLWHMNTTLRTLVDDDDHDSDFTSNSFLASTPAQRRHPRKIDELAQREIEELESKAVTTRALDQIDQHSPNAVLRRTSSQRLRDRAVADGLLSPSMSPTLPSAKSSSPSRIPVRRQNGIANKENVPVNGEVDAGFKAPIATAQASRAAQPLAVKQISRPIHQRNDSLSLLRKLARVSSMSPSPARDRSEPEVAACKPIESEGISEPHHLLIRASNRIPDVDTTPLPQHLPMEAETPKVTGAWIDTMMNAEAQEESEPPNTSHHGAPANSNNNTAKEPTSKVSRPKSALDAIVREAKEQPGTQNFGESTMQSLEDIVHPDMGPTDTSITANLDEDFNAHENIVVDSARTFTQAEKDRRQEQLAMEAMSKHLRTARTSMKDANRGLRRVENKIDAVGGPAPSVNDTSPKVETATSTLISLGPGRFHCAACGGGYHSVWKALWIEIRSCFYTWDPNHRYRMRFTWLGLACIFWTFYILSEFTLCDMYCNKKYGRSPYGKLPDPDAPELPFVIPTLLFRPLRWLWKPVCDALAEGLGIGFHALFGDTLASPDPPHIFLQPKSGTTLRQAFAHTPIKKNEWLASATATGARVAWSVLDVVDEAGSMWDDEFLR